MQKPEQYCTGLKIGDSLVEYDYGVLIEKNNKHHSGIKCLDPCSHAEQELAARAGSASLYG